MKKNNEFKLNNVCKKIVKLIEKYYGIKLPYITSINNLDNQIIITLVNQSLEIINYQITINYDESLNISVKLSNKDYTDVFRFYKDGDIRKVKSVYENKDNYKKIEKLNPAINITPKTLKYEYIDDNKSYAIRIRIPDNLPFIENLYLNSIINSNTDINNIEDLYFEIKHKLGCNDAYIEVTDSNSIETIITQGNELIRYNRMVGNKIYEYNNLSKNIMITEINYINQDSGEYRMILKKIRS